MTRDETSWDEAMKKGMVDSHGEYGVVVSGELSLNNYMSARRPDKDEMGRVRLSVRMESGLPMSISLAKDELEAMLSLYKEI